MLTVYDDEVALFVAAAGVELLVLDADAADVAFEFEPAATAVFATPVAA